MSRWFSPKNRLDSVIIKLSDGLEDGSIYLNDQELIEDGYEIHSIGRKPAFHVFILLTFLFVSIVGLLVFSKLIGDEFGIILSFLLFMFVHEIVIYKLFNFHYKQRYITKKSSRP